MRIFLLLSVLLSSCISSYLPSSRNTPLFKEKGEFQSAVSFGNGFNLNSAYAVTNHLAFSVNGLYANNKLLMPDLWRVHKSAEASMGFYTNRNRIGFEVFAGYGIGSGNGKSNRYEPQSFFEWLFISVDDEEVSSSYRKVFIQPSIGIRNKRAEFITTLRFSYVEFTSISVVRYENHIQLPQASFYFWEPSFTVKMAPAKKLPALFMFGQAGINLSVFPDEQPNFGYSFLHYSIGIGLRLSKAKVDQ